MFKNPIKPSSTTDEGTVLQVDANRGFCKVQTISGQNLDGVQWLSPVGGSSRGGDRIVPTLGDRVKIDYGLGYPVIVGCLPRMQTADNRFPLSIDTGETLVDTGNYSSDGVNAIPDQSKPKDLLVGDRILASVGGGMIAVLRAGSVLLRSSRLSEIFLSKWDDLVRVVSRNWEHFTDLSSDVVKNLRGRVYRYTGYAKSFADAKIENYQYHLYYGDTVMAETVKTHHQNPPAVQPAGNVIFKEQVTDATGELMHRTLDLAGNEEVYVKVGATFTRMKATGAELTFSFGDKHTVTINTDKIEASYDSGKHVVTIDASKIQANYENQQIVTIDGSKIELDHSAGGQVLMDGSGIKQTFSGHFITLDASGISMG